MFLFWHWHMHKGLADYKHCWLINTLPALMDIIIYLQSYHFFVFIYFTHFYFYIVNVFLWNSRLLVVAVHLDHTPVTLCWELLSTGFSMPCMQVQFHTFGLCYRVLISCRKRTLFLLRVWIWVAGASVLPHLQLHPIHNYRALWSIRQIHGDKMFLGMGATRVGATTPSGGFVLGARCSYEDFSASVWECSGVAVPYLRLLQAKTYPGLLQP